MQYPVKITVDGVVPLTRYTHATTTTGNNYSARLSYSKAEYDAAATYAEHCGFVPGVKVRVISADRKGMAKPDVRVITAIRKYADYGIYGIPHNNFGPDSMSIIVLDDTITLPPAYAAKELEIVYE